MSNKNDSGISTPIPADANEIIDRIIKNSSKIYKINPESPLTKAEIMRAGIIYLLKNQKLISNNIKIIQRVKTSESMIITLMEIESKINKQKWVFPKKINHSKSMITISTGVLKKSLILLDDILKDSKIFQEFNCMGLRVNRSTIVKAGTLYMLEHLKMIEKNPKIISKTSSLDDTHTSLQEIKLKYSGENKK